MASDRPVLPPSRSEQQPSRKLWRSRLKEKSTTLTGAGKDRPAGKVTGQTTGKAAGVRATAATSGSGRTRTAHLRLTRIDPVSVMKMAFLLSIAMGIVLVVAVTIIWSVLSAVGVWDNINSAVQQVIGTESGDNFDVSQYIGTARVIGFTLIASVINVVLLTAIATLSAFVYNLAAALLGGVEMTWSEDR